MIALEIAGFIVLLVMAVSVTWMMFVGLISVVGGVRLRRCRSCGHLLAAISAEPTGCPYCKHPRLLHRFAHARVHHILPGEW